MGWGAGCAYVCVFEKRSLWRRGWIVILTMERSLTFFNIHEYKNNDRHP